jgi:hypothetical protein
VACSKHPLRVEFITLWLEFSMPIEKYMPALIFLETNLAVEKKRTNWNG